MNIHVYLEIEQPDGYFAAILIPSEGNVYFRRRPFVREYEEAPRSHGFWRYTKEKWPHIWERCSTPAEAFPGEPVVGIHCNEQYVSLNGETLYLFEKMARQKLGMKGEMN